MKIREINKELSAITIACQGDDAFTTFGGGAEDPGAALSMLMTAYCEILIRQLEVDFDSALSVTEGAMKIAYAMLGAEASEA